MEGTLFGQIEEFAREQRNTRLAQRLKMTRQTTLGEDLGFTGTEGADFILAFSERFDVDISTFDPNKNFGADTLDLLPPFSIKLIYWIHYRRPMPDCTQTYDPTLGDLEEAVKTGKWADTD